MTKLFRALHVILCIGMLLQVVPVGAQDCATFLREEPRASVMNGLDPTTPTLVNLTPTAVSVREFRSLSVPRTVPDPTRRMAPFETTVYQLEGQLCRPQFDARGGVFRASIAADCRPETESVSFFVPVPSICGSSSPLAAIFAPVYRMLTSTPEGRRVRVTAPGFVLEGYQPRIGPAFLLAVEGGGPGGGSGGSAGVTPIGTFPGSGSPGSGSPGSGPPAPPVLPSLGVTISQPAILENEASPTEWQVGPAGTIVVPVQVTSAGEITEQIRLSAVSSASERDQFAITFSPDVLEATGGHADMHITAGPMAFAQPYHLNVTAAAGELASSASLTVNVVCDPPLILGVGQPASVAAPAGSTAMFTASALGSGPFSYQWYRGFTGMTGSPVEGAYGEKLTVVASNSDMYWVRISNACGTADSNPAQLTVTAGTPQSKRRAGK
jgi:hypothetical protein